jgi:hypothetical protein
LGYSSESSTNQKTDNGTLLEVEKPIARTMPCALK